MNVTRILESRRRHVSRHTRTLLQCDRHMPGVLQIDGGVHMTTQKLSEPFALYALRFCRKLPLVGSLCFLSLSCRIDVDEQSAMVNKSGKVRPPVATRKTTTTGSSARTIVSGEEAIAFAEDYLKQFGELAAPYRYVSESSWVQGIWCVMVSRRPETPGGYTVVMVSAEGKIISVTRGE